MVDGWLTKWVTSWLTNRRDLVLICRPINYGYNGIMGDGLDDNHFVLFQGLQPILNAGPRAFEGLRRCVPSEDHLPGCEVYDGLPSPCPNSDGPGQAGSPHQNPAPEVPKSGISEYRRVQCSPPEIDVAPFHFMRPHRSA